MVWLGGGVCGCCFVVGLGSLLLVFVVVVVGVVVVDVVVVVAAAEMTNHRLHNSIPRPETKK